MLITKPTTSEECSDIFLQNDDGRIFFNFFLSFILVLFCLVQKLFAITRLKYFEHINMIM